MALFEQISKDIVVAMKAKDKVALEALRNIKKFFLEAKTAPGANDELTDDAAMKILAKLAKQGKDTAALYVGQGRQDLASGRSHQPLSAQAALGRRTGTGNQSHYCCRRRYECQGYGQSDGHSHETVGRQS